MTEAELHDVMTYLFADFDAVVLPEKRRVWFDQFKHVDANTARLAAKLLLSRKCFGLPRAHDFALVIAEVSTPRQLTWGEAWDLWVTIARRWGLYKPFSALEEFSTRSKIGARAIGQSYNEYFYTTVDQLPTLRAQFRQRYEDLVAREQADAVACPEVRELIAKRFPAALPAPEGK